MPANLSPILATSGWRHAYIILGMIMAAVIFVPVTFLFKSRPSSHRATDAADQETEMRDAKKTSFFAKPRNIVLSCILFAFTLTSATLIYMLTPYLQDIGYSSTFASFAASAAMAVLAVGKLVSGVLLDKRGLKTYIYISFMMGIIGMLGLIFFRSPICLLPVLVGIFLACPFGTVVVPELAKHVDRVHLSETVGTLTAVCCVGPAFSPFLSGFVFDVASSYVPLFIGGVVLVSISVLLVHRLFPQTSKCSMNPDI